MAVKDNMVKSPPKGAVRFSLSLSKEQKKKVIVMLESLDDIDDILSYVSKIKPKDLGKPINFW